MDRAPPALVALAQEAAAVDTTRDGFDSDSCRAQAQTFQRFHDQMTKTLREHANPKTPGALAFSASLRAAQRAHTSVSIAELRSPAAMFHLGLLGEVNQ